MPVLLLFFLIGLPLSKSSAAPCKGHFNNSDEEAVSESKIIPYEELHKRILKNSKFFTERSKSPFFGQRIFPLGRVISYETARQRILQQRKKLSDDIDLDVFSPGTQKALRREGISSIEELIDREELTDLSGLSLSARREIKAVLVERMKYAFRRARIFTLEDLSQKTFEELSRMPGLDRVVLSEIEKILAENELSLRDSL